MQSGKNKKRSTVARMRASLKKKPSTAASVEENVQKKPSTAASVEENVQKKTSEIFEEKVRKINSKLRRSPYLKYFGKITSLDETLRALEDYDKEPTIKNLKKIQKAISRIPRDKIDDKYGNEIKELQSSLFDDAPEKFQSLRIKNKGEKTDLLTSEAQEQLEQWIEYVVQKIKEGKFEEARVQLIEKGEALVERQGGRVKFLKTIIPRQKQKTGVSGREQFLQSTKIGDLMESLKKNLYNPSQDIIKITALTQRQINNLENDTDKALALLMTLEEYIHYYQARSNKYLSPSTGLFDFTQNLTNDVNSPLNNAAVNYDEIDVYAKILDWGFDELKEEYSKAYGEREKYKEWTEKRNVNS